MRTGTLPRSSPSASDIVRRLTAIDAVTAAWCAALGAIVVVLIAFPLSVKLNIWLDEAFTLHTTGAGLGMAWSQAVRFEDQPPLYFVIEAAWRRLDEASTTFARIPSILFAAAAVAVMVISAHRVAPRTPSLVVGFIAAFHPVIIWAAVEMRVYALVLLIGAVLTWTFFEGFLAPAPSRQARVWYVIFALGGLYTQYFVGFLLAAHVLTLIVLRRRSLVASLGLMSIVAVGFGPFLGITLAQVRSSGDSIKHASIASALHQIVDAVLLYGFPHDQGWTGIAKLAGCGLVAALLFAIIVIGRSNPVASAAGGVVLQLGFAIALFALTFAVVGVPFDLVRHLIVLLPSSVLLVAMLLSSQRRLRTLGSGLTVTLFAALALSMFWSEYHSPMAKLGDWQRVAAMFSASDPATPIAVFPAELSLPLHVYLPVDAVPIPRPMPFVLGYVAATRLSGEADVARVLDPLAARSERVWIVTQDECRPSDFALYDYHCGFLEAFLVRHYRREQTVVFRGIEARRYVRL